MIAQDPPSYSKSSLSMKRSHKEFKGGNGIGKNSNSNKRSNSDKGLYRGNAANGEECHNDASFQNENKIHVQQGNPSEDNKASNSKNIEKSNSYSESLDANTMIERNDSTDSKEIDAINSNEVSNEEVEEEEDEEDEEPDWATIAEHEPAKADVPIFMDARDRREVAEARFASALDEAHASLKQCSDDLLETAADLYNVQREKLDAMEAQLKQDFVENELARSQMQIKLEESASAAQAQFAQLMMRVTQLGKGVSAIGSSLIGHTPNSNSRG